MASPPDTFGGLVDVLRESLRALGSDVGRLAEQHRLEIERLEHRWSSPAPERGEEALRILQPCLGVDLGAALELPGEGFLRPKTSVRGPQEPGLLAVFPEQVPAEDPKPPRPPQEPEAPTETEPTLLQWVEAPGVVREDAAENTSVVKFGAVMPCPAEPLGSQHSCPPRSRPRAASVPAGPAPATDWQGAVRHDEGSPPRPRRASEVGDLRELRVRVMKTRQSTCKRLSRESDESHGLLEPINTLRKYFSVRRALPDAVEMKEQVRKALSKPQFTRVQLFRDTGWAQCVARSSWFETASLVVIALNAIWIGVETDGNSAAFLFEAAPFYQVGEHFFCLYFVFEWLVHFLAFERKQHIVQDFWFMFDSVLVALLVADTWILMILRAFVTDMRHIGMGDAAALRLVKMARLLRLTRMSKLVRAFPELVVVIRGIGVAVRSVFFTLCLQVFIVYLFAIVFKRLTESTSLSKKIFPSVWEAMKTLFLLGVLPDFAPLIDTVGNVHAVFGIVMVFFILLASITVMNFIVGVLVEVVKVTSSVEREQLQINFVKRRMHEVLREIGLDEDDDPYVSLSHFHTILLHPGTATYMQDIGVDVVGLVDFTDALFRDGQDVRLSEFFQLIMSLRGTNATTVKDVVDLRNFILSELRVLESNLLRHMNGADSLPSEKHGSGRSGDMFF